MSYFERVPQERLSLTGRLRKAIHTVIGRKPDIGWKW
jgi:hypothetical protein